VRFTFGILYQNHSITQTTEKPIYDCLLYLQEVNKHHRIFNKEI